MSVPTPPPAGAIIRRVERPSDQYTMVANSFARDMRLSFTARGIGLWLLSHADGFEVSATTIARQARIGRDQVRRALVELEHHRYLRRTRSRDDAGRLASAIYTIRCTPFPPETEENPTSNPATDIQALAGAHHKKNSSKNNTTQKTNPSGGTAAAMPNPGGSPEDKTMPSASQPPLALELELPTSPPPTRSPGAPDVVAAYVESYRRHHSGGNPLRRDIGRIARDAKTALRDATATLAELIAAARAMGATSYANLGVQVSKVRQATTRTGTRGPVAVSPGSAFAAGAAEQHARFLEEIRTDPEVARWVARDPAEVAKLITEAPDLAAVFNSVRADVA